MYRSFATSWKELFAAATMPLRARTHAGEPAPTLTPALDAARVTADLIAPEIARARRHERPFAVLYVPTSGRSSVAVDTALDAIRPTLRETDSMAVSHKGITIVLPETERMGVVRARERLAAVLDVEPASIRRASFPDDALTTGGLCAVLDERSDVRLQLAGRPHDRLHPNRPEATTNGRPQVAS